jgi:D-alanine-D-alanine ligase
MLIDPKNPSISSTYPGGRWVLKPRCGVMSETLDVVDDAPSWRRAIGRAMHPMHGGQEFLAEEFIPGLNLAAPVIDGFPPNSFTAFLERGEKTHNILTKSGKEGTTADYGSEPYSGPGAAEATAAAAKLAAALGPLDFARFDFRFEPVSNRLVFLEVNINCAIGPLSVAGQAAALRGVDHLTLMRHIIAHSLRHQRKAK